MEQKRLQLFVTVLIGFVLLFALGCQQVEKPVVNGQGKLALEVKEGIPAPDYHSPIDKWTSTHMEKLARGQVALPNGQPQQISEADCQGCHPKPDKFCNRCHKYVGVKTISYK